MQPHIRAPLLWCWMFPLEDFDFSESHKALLKRASTSEVTVQYCSVEVLLQTVLHYFCLRLSGKTGYMYVLLKMSRKVSFVSNVMLTCISRWSRSLQKEHT